MRHRRRSSSQKILTRKNTAPITPQADQKHFKALFKIFKYIALSIIITAGMYLLYGQISQPVIEFFNPPASANLQPKVKDKPASLPVEEKPVIKEPLLTPVQRKVQVEVLNGCGEDGVAKVVAEKLKANDFDVINSGNYIQKGKVKFDQPTTKIIDQVGSGDNKSSAKEIARLMGVDYDNIESIKHKSPIADITIIIGRDYKKLDVFRQN